MPAPVKYIAFVLLLLLLVALLFPVNPWEAENSAKTRVKKDVQRLVAAVRMYRAEYGKYPRVEESGDAETAAQNASLMAALRRHNPKANPRDVAFLELSATRNTDVFVDVWGHHYRVRFDADEDGWVESPYNDEPHQLRADVIAWSVGPDGMQGLRGSPATLNGSDDIVSWK